METSEVEHLIKERDASSDKTLERVARHESDPYPEPLPSWTREEAAPERTIEIGGFVQVEIAHKGDELNLSEWDPSKPSFEIEQRNRLRFNEPMRR